MLNGGVGLVATKARLIKSGTEYDRLFPSPEKTDPYLSYNGTNEQTLKEFIPNVVKTYINDTVKIALFLKQETLEQTLRSIFNFIYEHIQYKPDSPTEEQIRRPARSWYDRKSGVDCDCYTVFISSILTNLRIPHSLRMSAYSSKRGYQHVYVVVPKKKGANMSVRSNYWVIDPVLDAFDTEKPYLFKKDKVMLAGIESGLNGLPIRSLNGSTIGFANRSNLVYDDVYYSPQHKTWALKGLDGTYYIRGNKNQRYVQSHDDYYGVDGLFKKIGKIAKKVVKTGVKLAAPLAKAGLTAMIPGAGVALSVVDNIKKSGAGKIVSSAISAGKSVQSQVSNAKSAIQSQVVDAKTAVQSAVSPEVLQQKLVDNSNHVVQNLDVVKQNIEKSIKDNNRATVMSLDALNKDVTKNIDKTFERIQPELDKITQNAENAEQLTKQVNEAVSKAIALTAGSQALTKDIQKSITEQEKQTVDFKNEVNSKLKTTQYLLIGLGVLMLIITFKNKF